MIDHKILIVLGCILHAHSTLAIWSCTLDADCSAMVDSVCQEGECVCPLGKQAVLGGTVCADVAPYHFSPCLEDFQCARLFTNFQCRRPDNTSLATPGNCGCSPNNHYFRGRCWPNRDLGESCTRSEECRGVLSDPFSMSCLNGVCGCSDGYFMRQRGECRRRAEAVGEPCVVSEDCQFPGGVCDTTTEAPFKCIFTEITGPTTVPPTTIPPQTTEPVDPTEAPPPEDQTTTTTEEISTTTQANTPPPITLPPVTFPPLIPSPPEEVENPDGDNSETYSVKAKATNPETIAVPETTVNKETTGDLVSRNGRNDGSYGAFCSDEFPCSEQFACSSFGTCICPLGYYPNTQRTVCLAELGSPVTPLNPCEGIFTEVRDGVCSCWANFFFGEDMRTCVKAARTITDACTSDANCQTFGAHAQCGAPGLWGLRQCQCDTSATVWDQGRHICRLFAGVGETCTVDSDCLAGDLEIQCVVDDEGQGRCACPPGFDEIDGLCLTLGLELGDSCQVDLECSNTDNAVCDGVCACASGYQQVGDICAPMIGGTCSVDADCVISNTGCSNITNTCQCNSGFVEYQDYCWTVETELEAPCNVTAQCIDLNGGSRFCQDGRCSCSPGTHFRDESCWPQTGLFEACSRTSQCFLGAEPERVHCRNSLCQCTFDFPYSEELGTCTSSAVKNLASIMVLVTAAIFIFSS